MSDSSEVELALGYSFRNPGLLTQALTHKSFGKENNLPDNQRLEFLGDAVLQLASSQRLYERHVDADEGKLSFLRQSIVSRPALAQVGRILGLHTQIRVGRGSAAQQHTAEDKVVADAFEAVLGAIYVDGGYEPCFQLIQRVVEPVLARLDAEAVETGTAVWVHPWNRLQEFTESRWKLAPIAEEIGRVGTPPAQIVTVEIRLARGVLARGEGPNAKVARKQAAEAALLRVAELVNPKDLEVLDAEKTAAPGTSVDVPLETTLTAEPQG